VFLLQKALPVVTLKTQPDRAPPIRRRISRVPPSCKNGYFRNLQYWQATDKALENSRLFGIMPCRSLSLASTGGHCSKKDFGNSKKNKKMKFPCFSA